MVITIDTSILVRANSRSSGPGRKLLERIVHEGHVLALSPYILDEVARVLNYPRLQRLYGLAAAEISEYINELRGFAKLVEPADGPPIIVKDPKDDPVLYTALAAKADILCAFDEHFYLPSVTDFCRSNGIEVMRDVELLRFFDSLSKPT